MKAVTVVGSYIVALVIDTDLIPCKGETVIGGNFHRTHGGKGSNMACCASRLGSRAAFIGKVGRDKYARGLVALLAAEHVADDGLVYSDALPTAVGFIVACSDGSNIVVIDPAACGDLSIADVESRRATIESSGVLLLTGEIPLETALHAAAIAARSGVPTILNPAPARDLRALDLGAVFALTPNETEARVCLGMSPRAEISPNVLGQRLLALGARNIVVTLGAKGSLWVSRNGICCIPPLPVRVLDTVGAGDAFNAGLATGICEGMSMEDALVLASATASLSTEKRETIASYPRRAAVNRRIGDMRKDIVPCYAASR